MAQARDTLAVFALVFLIGGMAASCEVMDRTVRALERLAEEVEDQGDLWREMTKGARP